MPQAKRYNTAIRVHLPKEQSDEVKRIAGEMPASEFIREALSHYLRSLRQGVVVKAPLSFEQARELNALLGLLGDQSETQFVQEAIARHLTYTRRQLTRQRVKSLQESRLAVA